jgi:hypothetical protein
MIGGNLPDADELLMKLISNNEVLEVNQHCENSREVINEDDLVIWMADVPGSKDKYAAIFNLSERPKDVSVSLSRLKLGKELKVRDLWEGKDLGIFNDSLITNVPLHGSRLFRLSNP